MKSNRRLAPLLSTLTIGVVSCGTQNASQPTEFPEDDWLGSETARSDDSGAEQASDALSEAPSCSTAREAGISCTGAADGLRGCRDLAERRCGKNNYRVVCADSQGQGSYVSMKYACVQKQAVAEAHRARKVSTGLCSSDADCAAGPGWEEVCFSTVLAPMPTAGQCGDLRQVVAGNAESVASNATSEQKCTATKPCGNGETCIRLLSTRSNVCVMMQ